MGVLPSDIDNYSKEEKLILLALIKLNEEEEDNKLRRIIALAISDAYGVKA